MRTFFDSVNASAIPADAQGVCGYIDGRFAWSSSDWARFPRAVKVQIAVFSTTAGGHVLDVEPGCASPVSAPAWVRRRRAVGVDPTVYCALSDWANVRAAFKAAGEPEPHWWIAAYPGCGPKLYPGSIAHQYQGGMRDPYDVSAVADYWPGVDPKTTQGDDMDAEQDTRLRAIETTLNRLAFGLDPGGQVPYSSRGEIPARLRTVDKNTAAKPDVGAIAQAVLAAVPTGGPGFTVEALAKAINDDAAARMAT